MILNDVEDKGKKLAPPIIGLYQSQLKNILANELNIQKKIIMESVLSNSLNSGSDPENNKESIGKLKSQIKK